VDGKLDIGDEKPKKKRKPGPGRPRLWPEGVDSRSNEAKLARKREREKRSRVEKARRKLSKGQGPGDKEGTEKLQDSVFLDEDGLTTQERIAVENYLAYHSKRKALLAAGERPGSKILENETVQKVIARELAERSQKFRLDSESVLRNLAYLEHFDPALLFGPDGSPVPVNQLPIHVRYCIESIQVEDMYEGRGEDRRYIGQLISYKFPAKAQIKALSMKHLKLLDGSGAQNRDRLDELIKAFHAGPVKPNPTVIEGQEVKHENPTEPNSTDDHSVGGDGTDNQ